MLSIFLFFSCIQQVPLSSKDDNSQTDSQTDSASVVQREVRADVITTSADLFGGTAAEGQLGDYIISNNKVRFIIQSDRPSNYYVVKGGGLLDGDIVRPTEEAGRDFIDEHSPMAGFGQIVKPQSIEIIDDGSSGEAIIRVNATGTPFQLLQGAVESEEIIPSFELTFQVDYKLKANSHLLEVTTKLTWLDDPLSVQLASAILVGKEVLDLWNPGNGLFGTSNNTWYGSIGRQNEAALGLFPSQGMFTSSIIQPLLEDETPAMSGFDENVYLEDGDTHTSTHYIGLALDLATLTDEWYAVKGVETEELSGTATSNGEPVAGARVHIFGDGEALTLAVTKEDGTWSAQVPKGQTITYQITGRGHAEHFDVPPGSGWYGIYGHEDVRNKTLSTIGSNLTSHHFAEGYGIAAENSDELTTPAQLTIKVDDGAPATVLVQFAENDPYEGASNVPGRPSGYAAMAYIRDGDITIPIEPGNYQIIVHRGLECEYDTQNVTLTSGEATTVTANIECLTLPENIYTFDPHTHSSPSGDGEISMTGRLLTHAAHGIDIHVSTEHDHVADFRPLLSALGLDNHLSTILGTETSPPIRGHMNSYPLTARQNEVNSGSPKWWVDWSTTEDLHTKIRNLLPEYGIIQANHATSSSGLFNAAAYNLNTGAIGKKDFWSAGFDVMELINEGGYQNYLPYYFDLISRGYQTGAVGVSDSHTHTEGMGYSLTYLQAASTKDVDIMEALAQRRTVPSRGPYIHATINNQWAPGQTFIGPQELTVQLYHSSWIIVDTVNLYENGTLISTQPASTEPITFSLAPAADAHYSVIAEGTLPMAPIYGSSPWAITSALYIDVDGDGWTPPLPPLQ